MIRGFNFWQKKKEIKINYAAIEECEGRLINLATRIDTVRANKLEMPESKGEMAAAVLEQYEQLDCILLELNALVDRVLNDVRDGKAKFQQMDEGMAIGGGRRR